MIRSPTKNPLTFSRTCQMVIFAPCNRALVVGFLKYQHKKKPFWKKSFQLHSELFSGRAWIFPIYRFSNINFQLRSYKVEYKIDLVIIIMFELTSCWLSGPLHFICCEHRIKVSFLSRNIICCDYRVTVKKEILKM